MPENGSDPGFLQAVELGACEIFLVPFRSRVMVSYHLLGCPECMPHWPSKPDILGVHLPGGGPLSWGAQWKP